MEFEELGRRLNLNLAYKRVKFDFKDATFIDHPYELTLIETDFTNWIESLRESICENRYLPDDCRIIDCSKPNWHIRPAGLLRIEDNVLYSALLIDIIEKIAENLKWSSDKIRFSHIIADDSEKDSWFILGSNHWKFFNEKSENYLDNGFEYTLFSDIAAFYENIDLKRLISDLRVLNIPDDTRILLTKCLTKWSGTRRRGIPQGFSPSNILSEFYLDSIDKELMTNDIAYLRFSDDIRIFSKSKKDSILNLHFLTRALRNKGLNLQNAKTKIETINTARKRVADIAKIISEIQSKSIRELSESFEYYNQYFTPSELRDLVSEDNIEISLETLEKAFEKYFESGCFEFNKSIFHFIINRFGPLRNSRGVKYSLGIMPERPEETKHILRYFSDLVEKEDIAEKLATMINDGQFITEYQIYQIIKWIWKHRINNKEIIDSIRYLVSKGKLQKYTREYCVAYLGDFGESSDFDVIERFLREETDPRTKSMIYCSLRRMEKSRRNEIYSTATDECYSELAIKWAKKNS